MAKSIDLNLEEGTRVKLLDAVVRFKKTRQEALWPVYDELIHGLERGVLTDAYMARYLRDTLTLGEKDNAGLKSILEKLDGLF